MGTWCADFWPLMGLDVLTYADLLGLGECRLGVLTYADLVY